MRDVFGADAGTISEGAPAVPSPTAVAVATQAAAAPTAVVVPAGTPIPTVAQAVDKAVAKAAADQKVATDPQAVHAVQLATTHPNVLGATLAGAAAGSVIPVVGTLLGAAIGFVSSKYQINLPLVGTDPLGRATSKVVSVAKGAYSKAVAPSKLPAIPGLQAPPPPAQ